MKEWVKYVIFYGLVIVAILWAWKRNKDEPLKYEVLKKGVDTKGYIYRYKNIAVRNIRDNVFYYFIVNGMRYNGTAFINFSNCQYDSSCIGKTYRVRYLPSDPNVHQIFFYDKRNGINWTDTIPEKR